MWKNDFLLGSFPPNVPKTADPTPGESVFRLIL